MSDKLPDVKFVEVDYDPFASAELSRVVPSTEAQRELWLADQLGSEASLAYNESISLRISGPLQRQALQDALRALSNRHEALRATFSADGLGMQIAPQGNLQADVQEHASLAPQQQLEALGRLRSDAVRRQFSLVDGPLVRAVLVCVAPEQHELIITAHHIVCDGWSFGVLSTELMTLYAALADGRGINALAAAESFGDYALAQLDEAHEAAADTDTRWWVQQYDGSVPVLQLPTDRPRPALRSFRSSREDLVLEKSLVDAVRKLGGRLGSSLFATMFSAFGALIARVSGQDDLVIGVPAAGQSAEGKHALVGHCVQLLPIRFHCDMEQPFDALLTTARTRVLDAFDHQACTFGQLLAKLQLTRDPSRLPLVSVLFNLDQAIESKELSVAGLQVDLQSNAREFENFELFLNASQCDGQIVLECQYNADLFDAESVRRWLQLYREALVRATTSPQRLTAQILAPTESDVALLSKFNDTGLAYPRELRIEAMIAARAAATPDAVAIVAGGSRLSYRELDHRANAVAEALRERGVKTGDLVGLYCGRNQHMIVGLLGILKAGAGYIPMDPAFPADRLEYMTSDANVQHIVSDASVEGAWKFKSAERVLIDGLGEQPAPPSRGGSPDDVAYVIYTSGSTGRPKGVRVPHRTVTNLLVSVTREPGMVAGNVVLSVTTLSFDIAVSEVILPLTVGARIVVADRAQATDGDRLRDLIECERVDFIDATPSTWRLLLAAGWAGGSRLKAICTGEPLPPDLGRMLLPLVAELWNGYGPTETTVWSSFYRVMACDGPVPIGHPVANTHIHVVDSKQSLLPIGVVGELFIGGEGVTLGYLGRPDLTEERFLPDPFNAGRLWYKTGDLGRWRADGVLECLGRSDHQVKVRGYRIELGEIEASLSRHADVDRAVVVTREDEPGDVRLVAYVVSAGPELDSTALRDFLRLTLPEYMIPAHVMQLKAIPLLPNGKIDRNGLPRPEIKPGDRERMAPRNPLEAQLLTAMEQVLNLPGLGIRDDFFALGGHSLLAAKLTARLNKELGLALPLRLIFETPTAEGLARAVEAAKGSNAPKREPVVRLADQSEAPLTVMQERIRFMEDIYPGRVVYNTPSAHRLKGPLDRVAFESALGRMTQRQASLRTCIVKTERGPVQRVVDIPNLQLPFEDLSSIPAGEREAELMRRLETVIDRPIPLDQAPLFRAALYRLAPEEHVFLFMPHHIIWDGWSFDLLYQEMSALYPAELARIPATLPPPPVSYIDYARWHQRWMSGEECRVQIEYWKKRYASIEAPRALPTDRPRSAGMSGAGAVEWVHVDKSLTERLRQVALDQGATLNMLVMAVYSAMMSQALSSRSLVLGIPVRGRLSDEVESVMGFFNNLLPTPLTVDPSLPLNAWVGIVKKELLDAFAHQDVPFERLAAEPEIAVHANRAGLYQSLFSFQDARERERRWGLLEHSSVLVMQKGATEDLGLWLMEVPSGLEGGINYNADLFDSQTASLFRDRFVTLLKRVAANPSQTVAELIEQPGDDVQAFRTWIAAHASQESGKPAASRTGSSGPRSGTPLSASESGLAQIWAALLGVPLEQIGTQDNFFDLGGNSLLAMQAVEEAERKLGLKVEPRRYLNEPLAAIAMPAGPYVELARIWADLLGIDASDVQPGDNFFDLGGNSLLVMRAAAETERLLGIKVDPRRYVNQTLQQLVSGDAAAAPVTGSTVPEKTARSGLVSRVLGKFGRGP